MPCKCKLPKLINLNVLKKNALATALSKMNQHVVNALAMHWQCTDNAFDGLLISEQYCSKNSGMQNANKMALV